MQHDEEVMETESFFIFIILDGMNVSELKTMAKSAISGASPPSNMVHKQGYLFKQGSYFSAWNERYFSLESSLLKQFQDVDSAMPSYSVYLGSAAVEGVFAAQSNEEAGYGAIWSIVIRWPLPMSPDAIEEQWGYMHIGSYEEKEIDEWYDSISALIKVEQTRRLLGELGNRAIGTNTPPDFLPIPAGRAKPLLHVTPHVKESIIRACNLFGPAYEKFVADFNIPNGRWRLTSTHDGMLYHNKDNDRLWKFTILVPRDDGVLVSSVTAKRLWEAILSDSPGVWEPQIKMSKYILKNSNVTVDGNLQLFTDNVEFTSSIQRLNFEPVDVTFAVHRLSLKDDRSGMFMVLGLPATESVGGGKEKISLESISWGIETILEHKSQITVLFEFSRKQNGLSNPIEFIFNNFSSIFSESISSHPKRIKEFILSQ